MMKRTLIDSIELRVVSTAPEPAWHRECLLQGSHPPRHHWHWALTAKCLALSLPCKPGGSIITGLLSTAVITGSRPQGAFDFWNYEAASKCLVDETVLGLTPLSFIITQTSHWAGITSVLWNSFHSCDCMGSVEGLWTYFSPSASRPICEYAYPGNTMITGGGSGDPQRLREISYLELGLGRGL